jgi:LDH2 family malate/lactate/ureidoglycolate dehydrogenase
LGEFSGYRLFPYALLHDFCSAVFRARGFIFEECKQITDVLLAADLAGIESHGIQRLIRYDQEISGGLVNPEAKAEIVFQTPLSAVMDAHDKMGQLSGIEAMNLAIEKAKTHGVGIVTVRDSNHYGIAGFYTHMAAEKDLIGICMTNTQAIMVPTFSSQAMLGTNPIALAMPAEPCVFSFDASTTVVTRGKLEVYSKRGEPAPEGWLLDENGLETTDVPKVLSNIIAKRGGGILPLGGAGETTSGYKGYGFALLCELFTGVLSGGTTSNHIYETPGRSNIAHCFMAIDYALFGDKKEIRERFSHFLQELRNANKATGQERIYIHGEKEWESAKSKMTEGIPLNTKTYAEMHSIARKAGIDPLDYLPD